MFSQFWQWANLETTPRRVRPKRKKTQRHEDKISTVSLADFDCQPSACLPFWRSCKQEIRATIRLLSQWNIFAFDGTKILALLRSDVCLCGFTLDGGGNVGSETSSDKFTAERFSICIYGFVMLNLLDRRNSSQSTDGI